MHRTRRRSQVAVSPCCWRNANKASPLHPAPASFAHTHSSLTSSRCHSSETAAINTHRKKNEATIYHHQFSQPGDDATATVCAVGAWSERSPLRATSTGGPGIRAYLLFFVLLLTMSSRSMRLRGRITGSGFLSSSRRAASSAGVGHCLLLLGAPPAAAGGQALLTLLLLRAGATTAHTRTHAGAAAAASRALGCFRPASAE